MDNKQLEPLTVRMPLAKKLTGLGETKLRELMADGVIKFKKVGRATLIDFQSLKSL